MIEIRVTGTGAILLAALLLHWMPLWRREQLWFGVTVPVGFYKSADGIQVMRGYRVILWSLAALALVCAIAGRNWPSVGAGVAFMMLGVSLAFARARRQTLPFAVKPSPALSASLELDREGLPGGWIAALGPFVMLAATALYLQSQSDRLPARIPIHWTLFGVADRWAARSWSSVFGALLVSAGMVVFSILANYAILRASPRGRVAGTEAWTTRFRHANLRLLMISAWGVAVLMSSLSLSPVLATDGHLPGYLWIAPALFFVAMLPFVLQIIRISREPKSASDGTPDECWKLGQIYFNPGDPALMVEKRFGVGYTLNLANPIAWVVIGFAVVVMFVVFRRRI